MIFPYITLLLLCQLAGEVLAHLFKLSIPGPVIGMVLLFLGLMVRGQVPAGLEQVSRGLLVNLALLFIPAGVGILTVLPMVLREWLPITATVIVSTLLGIGVTASIMAALTRKGRS